MRKSLFAKYFTVCSVIILSSFVFLGTIFSVLVSRYLRTERQQMLSENVAKAVSFTLYNYEINNNVYLETRSLRQFYASMADAANGVMFLTDIEGNTLICSEDGTCIHKQKSIPKSTLLIMDGSTEYEEYGRLGAMYSSFHYSVGRAIRVGEKGDIIGYVFASTSANTIGALLSDIVKMFLIAAIIAILMSSIVIYILTSVLSRPLRQMSAATKSFSRGDFSTRITYHSMDEVGELALSFNQMADSLSELEMMRKNFIANVSHELKTPMTTIGGFIDGILDGTIPQNQQEHYLKLVSDEVGRLSRLVKAMLNVAKIEAGETKINATVFNISDIIFTTLFSFEKKIEDKKIDIRGLSEMDKIMVCGDRDLIHQVLYNLIDNAVKFCNDEGYLEFISKSENGKCYIHVKNSGNGLSKEELNHVFDRFYKTDKSRGLDKTGVGLGLHIVKTIVDMHGGDITVGSVRGEYTEFIIGLPLYIETSDEKSPTERKFLRK
ncbi:MAG: HAMP domain-containing sensor histidine kinase [Oscillospiraceae bacterium]|nr:HAMP domain-containing sensor histidine kinase [Oscillospiraceae bacterium]